MKDWQQIEAGEYWLQLARKLEREVTEKTFKDFGKTPKD